MASQLNIINIMGFGNVSYIISITNYFMYLFIWPSVLYGPLSVKFVGHLDLYTMYIGNEKIHLHGKILLWNGRRATQLKTLIIIFSYLLVTLSSQAVLLFFADCLRFCFFYGCNIFIIPLFSSSQFSQDAIFIRKEQEFR